MKVRTSFVSNSSSSSFILVGFKTNLKDLETSYGDDWDHVLSDMGYNYQEDENGDFIIGDKLCTWSEGEGESFEFNLYDVVNTICEDLHKMPKDIRIFGGDENN